MNTAIKLQNDSDAAYRIRGDCYRSKGQYDEAIKDFEQAIKLNSSLAVNYAWCGNTYSDIGQRSMAIQYLEKAITLNPDYEWAKKRLRDIRGW